MEGLKTNGVTLLILGVLIGFGLICNKLCNVVIKPRRVSFDEAIQPEIEKGNITKEWFSALERKQFTVASKFGYTISAELIEVEQMTKKFVIICHGFSYNRVGSYKYAKLFLDLGYHTILFDHRNNGDSGGESTTMGHFESQDLVTLIDYLQKTYGYDCQFGTHGESMGASTVLLHAAMDPRVEFVVADCGYSDLKEQLESRLKIEYRLPGFPFIQGASLTARLRAGFWFGQVSPVKEIIKQNGLPQTPILFIHGLKDSYIDPRMCDELYAAKTGFKAQYLVEGAGHGQSICTAPLEYERQVSLFLDRYVEAPFKR